MNFDISNNNLDVQYKEFNEPTIDFINSSGFSFKDFFDNYLLKNVPCVIRETTNSWRCRDLWIDQNRQINVEYLKRTYGKEIVPVANCSEKYFNAQKKSDQIFENYLDYLNRASDAELLYLKDWHLARKFLDRDKFYSVPAYFVSDWLNEYSIGNNIDDYRFVYMGPKNTWTPFHVDVFSSYSWSVNVFGRKRWLLFPPGEEKKLHDPLGNLPYDCERGLARSNCRYYEIFQESGDAIFVPSEWHHQVWNVETTISINHNWINGCNIDRVHRSMMKHFLDIQKEIKDCKEMDDWDEQCQKMLKAIFGMDFLDFYQFLFYIAMERIKYLKNKISIVLFQDWKMGDNLVNFDLKQIKNVLLKFQNDYPQCECVLKQIDDIL